MMSYSQSAPDQVILLEDIVRAVRTSTQSPSIEHQRKRSSRSVIAEHVAASFRSISLQLVNYLSGWRNDYEPPKIAIQQNRTAALARAVVHLLPVGGCLALIVLNLQCRFIGSYTSWYATLQYVAKFHEILMQASIAAIFLGYIRQQIVEHVAIPFGGLFAAPLITNVSYLWSLEFWGALTAQGLRGWRKVIFAFLVLLSVLLAVSVGPSSAVAMLPRGIYVRLGATVKAITVPELFPTHITASDHAVADMEAIEQYILLNGGAIIGESVISNPFTRKNSFSIGSVRRLTISPASDSLGYIASIPPWLFSRVSGSLYTYWVPSIPETGPHSDYAALTQISSTTQSKQPYVHAECTSTVVQGDQNSKYLSFPSTSNGIFDHLMTEGQFWDSYTATERAHIVWLEAPEPHSDVYSAIAVMVSPKYNWYLGPTSNYSDAFVAFSCTARAAWLSSRINTTFSGWFYDDITDGHATNEQWTEGSDSWPRPLVSFDKNWTQSLTAFEETSPTVPSLHDLFLAAANNSGISEEICDGSGCSDTAEYILASMVATGMSGINSEANITWTESSSPFLGHDDGVPNNPTVLSFEFFVSAIGYSAQTFPIIFALTILAIYCAFALSYMVYSLISGVSSNSWDSVAEITTLALNSKCPDYLGHTRAGLQTIKVFQEPVRVRANDNEKLQMVFEKDKEINGTYRRVVRNQAY